MENLIEGRNRKKTINRFNAKFPRAFYFLILRQGLFFSFVLRKLPFKILKLTK